MSSADNPLPVVRYQVQKDKIVRFACPACKEVLNTYLKDATKVDHCPSCGGVFVSPGARELDALRKAHQAKLQAEKEELKQKQAAEAARIAANAKEAQAAAAKAAAQKTPPASVPDETPVFQQATAKTAEPESKADLPSKSEEAGSFDSDSAPLTLEDLSASSAAPPSSPWQKTPPPLAPAPSAPAPTPAPISASQSQAVDETPYSPISTNFSSRRNRSASSSSNVSNQNYPSLLFYIQLLRVGAFVVLGIAALAAVGLVIAWVLMAISGIRIPSQLDYWVTLVVGLVAIGFVAFFTALPMFVASELVRLLVDMRMDIGKIARDE